MRKYFPFLFFFNCFIFTNSYSQDLIVTNVGDSVDCKIVSQTKDYIHYTFTKYNNNTVRELRADLVKSVIPGFYRKKSIDSMSDESGSADTIIAADRTENLIVNADTSINIIAGDIVQPEFPRWQFGINGGYAYRLFKPKIKTTPYELKYLEELKSGYSLEAEAFYFPWEKVGFGLKYDMYKSTGQRDIRTNDDITIQFTGVSVAHRKTFENNKTSVISAFWLGYQPYRNRVRFVGQDYELNAKTMGWGVSVGLDHKLTKKLALSFSASCFMGSIYRLNKELKGRTGRIHLPRDKFEDLSRAELTVGLKFLK